MPDFTGADLYNAIFHLAFLAIYIEMVRRSVRGADLEADHVELVFSRLTRTASRMGGMASMVAAVLMSGFFGYFLYLNPTTLIFDVRVLLHVVIELIVVGFLFVSGFAMMRMWRFAPALYLISITSILTSTLFAMIFFGSRTHPIPMEIVGVGLSIVLILVFGIVYTAQYWGLYSKAKGRR
jgi:hypothetical protein